jgi:hypothetical protein
MSKTISGVTYKRISNRITSMSRFKIADSSAICRFNGAIKRRHKSSPGPRLDQIAHKAFSRKRR